MNASAIEAAVLVEDVVGEPADAVALRLRQATEAVEQARRQREPTALTRALVVLARVHLRLGHYAEAQALADEILAQAPPRSPDRADAWQVLANCAVELESPAQAEAYYRTAAELAREIGYHRAHVAALHGLAAGVYFLCGRFDLALAADAEVRRIASAQGRTDWLPYPLITTALIYQTVGRRQEAEQALAELSNLLTRGSITHGYYMCLCAELALDAGDLEKAYELLAAARPIAEASGEPWLNCAVRLGMSRYHRLAGHGPEARAWADDALAVARRRGGRYDQGRALIERSRGAWICGNLEAAEDDLRTAIELLTAVEAAFELARGRFLLAALLFEQQRPEATAAWLEAARAIGEGGYAFLLEQERSLAFPLLAAQHADAPVHLARVNALLLEHLRRVPPPPLHITMLGRFAVRQGNRLIEPRVLRQRRAGELLALLVLARGHRLLADQIGEALVPDKPPAMVQNVVHHATSALRRALEPDLPDKFPSRYLEAEEGEVVLHLPPSSHIDVEEFEALCRKKAWEEALALYGGELLSEYRYADWSIVPRERLSLLYQQALLGAAHNRLAAGNAMAALEACRSLLALEPWHEEATLLGMRACVMLNDLAGARRLYQKLAETLRNELHTVPQAELQDYYRSLTPPAPP